MTSKSFCRHFIDPNTQNVRKNTVYWHIISLLVLPISDSISLFPSSFFMLVRNMEIFILKIILLLFFIIKSTYPFEKKFNGVCVARRIKFVLNSSVIIPLINVGPETYKTGTFCDVLCYWVSVCTHHPLPPPQKKKN